MQKLEDWYWTDMETDVKFYVRSCEKCNLNNPPSGGYTKMEMGKLPETHKFNERIHYDLLGPLPVSSEAKFKYLLICVDAYSSYVRTIPLEDKSAQTVSKAIFRGWICNFSIPLTVTTDAGSEFNSAVFKELCNILGCKLTFSSIEHAMSNGAAERQVRNVISYMRKLIGKVN